MHGPLSEAGGGKEKESWDRQERRKEISAKALVPWVPLGKTYLECRSLAHATPSNAEGTVRVRAPYIFRISLARLRCPLQCSMERPRSSALDRWKKTKLRLRTSLC